MASWGGITVYMEFDVDGAINVCHFVRTRQSRKVEYIDQGKANTRYTLFLEEYCFSDSSSIFLIFWQFEAENILKIFLEYRTIEYVCQHGVAFPRLQMIAFIPLCNFLVHVLYNVSCYVHVEHELSQSRTSCRGVICDG